MMPGGEPELSAYLGLRQSALGLVLAFVGAGTLVALMVVTPLMLGEPDGERFKPWILLIGLWGVVAAGLGLRLRKTEASLPMIIISCLWLAPAIGFGLWVKFQ